MVRLADEVAERAAEPLLEHGGRAGLDVGAAALPSDDESGVDELADGLPDGRAADRELRGELVLRGEPGSRRIDGVRDSLPEYARDLVVERER